MALGILIAVVKGIVAWFVLSVLSGNLIGAAYGGFGHSIHRQSSDNPVIVKGLSANN